MSRCESGRNKCQGASEEMRNAVYNSDKTNIDSRYQICTRCMQYRIGREEVIIIIMNGCESGRNKCKGASETMGCNKG
jgi:hypothetical protein